MGDRLGGGLRLGCRRVEVQQKAEGQVAEEPGEGGGQESARVHAGYTAGIGESMQGRARIVPARKVPPAGRRSRTGGGIRRDYRRVVKLIWSENRPTAATALPFVLRVATRQRNRPLAGRVMFKDVEGLSVRLTSCPLYTSPSPRD